MKVILLPYAGSTKKSFLPLIQELKKNFEIIYIEFSGRGERNNEKQYTSFSEMVEDVYLKILESLADDQPYILFGHSLGAILAYICAGKIAESNRKRPKQLVLSGRDSPDYEYNKFVHNMTKLEFKNYLNSISFSRNKILDMPRIGDLYLNRIYSDYRCMEGYEKKNYNYLLDVPISVFYGKRDNTIKDVHDWSNYSTRKVSFFEFTGDHFYLLEMSNIRLIKEVLIKMSI